MLEQNLAPAIKTRAHFFRVVFGRLLRPLADQRRQRIQPYKHRSQNASAWRPDVCGTGLSSEAGRTVMDGLVRLEVHLVVLERGHALREDRENVPLFDGVMRGETWYTNAGVSAASRVARQREASRVRPHEK